MDEDLVVRVILWRLGVNTSDDPSTMSRCFQELKNNRASIELLESICKEIAFKTLGEALINGFTSIAPSDAQLLCQKSFKAWLSDPNFKLSPSIDELVRRCVKRKSKTNPVVAAPKVVPTGAHAKTYRPNLVQTPATKSPATPAPIKPPTPQPTIPPTPLQDDDTMSGLQWRYLPLPEAEPDPHDESFSQEAKTPNGYRITAARVRGKKHKHEGTHCDDWFEFRQAGDWTILAVSDGGGSYKLSRVGAKAACTAAIDSLDRALRDHHIADRDLWEAASFAAQDIDFVKEQLVESMKSAWHAIEQAVSDRNADSKYEQWLGRPLTTKDLYCTLLLTVHTNVKYGDGQRSLIFSLAVGDGMIGAIREDGKQMLLMTPDSGEHSGEVRFLEPREIDPNKLRSKIFPALCNLRCLMLMTDGVSDDYFPNDPGMLRLYGDLVLNGALPLPNSLGSYAENAVTVESQMGMVEVELPTLEGDSRKESVCSLIKLATALGMSPEDVVSNPSLLSQAVVQPPNEPHDNLLRWLDTYHVRGSFDDRTLLILHR